MKILNWNIYKKNRNIKKAIAFLKKQRADVICLQEFPETCLDLLKGFNGHVAMCQEVWMYKNNRKPATRIYSVIISRYPIKQQVIIPHKSTYGHIDRYQYFQADSLYVDIDTPEGLFRVFNAHFKCVTGPLHRLFQFMEVIGHFDPARHNIICGDFNSFGKPLVNVLLWKWFGYKAHEVSINENKNLVALLETHGLKNPLRKQVTFLKFPVQLDYILIPVNIDVKSSRAFSRPHGSDHFPLLLEI